MIAMGGNTQHTAAVVGAHWLVELDFKVGIQRVTTAPQTLTVAGLTFQGVGALGDVAAVTEGADSGAERLVLSLSVADTALLALALGEVDGYRGRAVRLALVLLDAQFQVVGTPVPRWSGQMERVAITRKPAEVEAGGDAGGTIELHCARVGMSRARNYEGLRLTLAQQQQRYPQDTGLRYVRTLVEQPALWLSKRFQEQ